MESKPFKKRKNAKKDKNFSKKRVVQNSTGVERGFKIKNKDVQFSKKRQHVAADGNEEPATKKQRKAAKNHVFFKQEASKPCELPAP